MAAQQGPHIPNFPMYEDPISLAMKAFLTSRQGQGQGIENQLKRAQIPYAQQNAQNDALIKQVQAQYAPKTAENAYQKSLVDLQRAEIEYKMYPDSEEAQNNLRRAQAAQANADASLKNLQIKNPGLLGGGNSKNITSLLMQLDALNKAGQGRAPQRTGTVEVDLPSLSGNNQPISGPTYANPYLNQQTPAGQPQMNMPSANIAGGPAPNMPQAAPQGDLYASLVKALENEVERAGMQPWEIAGLTKASEQNAVKGAETALTINEQATAAVAGISALQSMRDSFATLTENEKNNFALNPGETGIVGGRLPARSKEAQNIDAQVATLLQEAQKAWTGSLSDYDIRNIKKQFPTRVAPENFNDMADYLMAANLRVLERQKFIADGLAANKNINQLETEWNQKAAENSIYDMIKRKHVLEAKARQ